MASNTLLDIYTTPAGPPPPGQTPNLRNPHNRYSLWLATMPLCLSITSIVVVLRIFTRSFVMKQVRAEDYALIIAQLGFISWVVLTQVSPAQGRHIWDMSIYEAMQSAKYENYLLILYGPLTFLSKLSVLLQLQHIFVTSRRQAAFLVIQTWIWANLAFYLAYLLVDIFQCIPRAKIQDQSLPGKCISKEVLLVPPAGFNVFSDCLTLALPMVFVFRLNMALKNKITIAAVFGSGLFAIISSVTRLVYSIRAGQSTDGLRAAFPVALWAAAEFTTVTLAATLPIMPRLWKFIRTGDRNSQRYAGSDPRSHLTSWSRKLGRPMNVKEPITSTDAIPLGASYRELQDKKQVRPSGELQDKKQFRPSGELEMQILRTDSFEVTNRTGTPN